MSDDWDFYLAKIDNKPASIMVNLGIKPAILKTAYPTMGYLRIFMHHPREDGLSSQEEFNLLCNIGNAIETDVNSTKHIYVGRNTSNGSRDYYFYTSDPQKLEKTFKTIMGKFADYQYEIGNHEDKNWEIYKDFLFPDQNAMQCIMNRRICDNLESNGDNIHCPRKIDHRVYFKNKKTVSTFIDFISQQKFNILNTGRIKPIFGNYFIDFDRIDIPKNIEDVVIPLLEKVVELGGEYDGWGCTAVTTS